MTELELAREIACGRAPSPTECGGFDLWSVRISGTGRAVRTALDEVVYRDSGIWLSAETCSRVSGIPVLIEHPKSTLNSKEYADRAVGNVQFPYVANRDGFQNDDNPDDIGPDLWAVVRIYDSATNAMLRERKISTSPACVFKKSDGNTTFQMGDGSHVLIENTPSLIDHIAIVERGTWDLGDGPSGIRNDLAEQDTNMTDEPTMDAEKVGEEKTETEPSEKEYPGQHPDALLSTLDGLAKMCDGLNKRMDAADRRDARRRKDEAAEAEEDEPDAPKGTTRRVAADAATERKDAADKAAVQSRADVALMAFGQRAPYHMAGETLLQYRYRTTRELQRHSPDFAGIDLRTLTGPALDAVENRIYADAAIASKTPEIYPGQMREITKIDPQTGQRITTFHADHTFIHAMNRPARRVVAINTRTQNQ